MDQFFVRLEAIIKLVKPYTERLWQNRWSFIIINTLSLVAVLVWLIVLYSPSYESEVVIMPEYGGSQAGGSLSQITSLLGVSGGTGASMEVYERLIKTTTILEPVIYSLYYSYELEDSLDLADLMGVKVNPNLRQDQQGRAVTLKTVEGLEELITVSLDIQTKILSVKVIMPEGQMAAAVANNIISSLNYYLNNRRKTKASNQLFYLEKRMVQVRDSLTAAEDMLKAFRIQNRIISQSAELMLEQNRLIRNVDIMQAVYVELTKQLELIRLDEIRESPVLNVREPAADPIDKLNPKRRLKFTVAMMVSLFFSIVYCVFLPEVSETVKRSITIYRNS